MRFKSLLFVVMGSFFVSSVFGEDPRFDEEGHFLFFFTSSVQDMLKDRLEELPKNKGGFVFNQARFEALVNKINEWGWCELQDDEKREIVECLSHVGNIPTQQDRSFLLCLLEALRDINDDNLTTFCPSERDASVYSYINRAYESVR